jgi:hypothetical protein
MDAGVIIAIVVGALILLALFALLGRKGRERKLESNRRQAHEIRREAEVERAHADRTRAEADAQAAEARRQDALARERSAEADERHHAARDRHLEAASLDPDTDEDAAAAQYDREHSQHGITAHGYDGETEGEADRPGLKERLFGSNDDEHVEHYERTETPDAERERRFERDEDGNVVRDEEREQPRTTR